MIDNFIFLLMIIGALIALSLGAESQKIESAVLPSWLGRIAQAIGDRQKTVVALLWAIVVLVILQLALLLVKHDATLTSFAYVAPRFLNLLYSIFVLGIVVLVVALGVWQSFLQFYLWQRREELDVQGSAYDSYLAKRADKAARAIEAIAKGLIDTHNSEDILDDRTTRYVRRLRYVAASLRTDILAAILSTEPKGEGSPRKFDTTIGISHKGVTIATPMIGLATLVVSLAFLYLFLVYGRALTPQ